MIQNDGISHCSLTKINKLSRDEVEKGLKFVGFLVFHCPLKSDAVATLKMLADSSHRVRCHSAHVIAEIHTTQCIMITGDNPLTAVHVAKDVEIVDRDALILDIRENPANEKGLSLLLSG